MNKFVNIFVNDRPIKTKLGYTIMQSCAQVDIDVPKFCYHDKLVIAGNCRICLVEVVGSKKLLAACAVHASDNAVIYTNSGRVRVARQNVLEFLLANHPLDCPICDQGGECDLQDITALFGADRGRFYEHAKRAVLNKDFGPLIRTSMNRCIHCTRCVRFISFSSGSSTLGTLGRGTATEIGTYVGQFLFDELSGNITDLCPVGALTSKPYSFKVRPWELVSVESLDVFDSLNSSILVDVAANKVQRILPYSVDSLNSGWISNKARYAYDGLFVQRLTTCLIKASLSLFMFTKQYDSFSETSVFKLNGRGNDFFVKLSWQDAISIFFARLLNHEKIVSNVSVWLGATCDFTTILNTRNFFNLLGIDNFFSYSGNFLYSGDFDFLYLFNSSLLTLSTLPSFCLLVGVNPRFESPVLNLRLTQLCSDYAVSFYRIGGSVNFCSYTVKLLSSTFVTFFQICEFRHTFCKNFYILNFSAFPCVIVGAGALMRLSSTFIITALQVFINRVVAFSGSLLWFDNFFTKDNLFFSECKFFAILNTYSTWLQMLDGGLFSNLRNYTYYRNSIFGNAKLVLSSIFVNYFVGFESVSLVQYYSSFFRRVGSLSFWNIYQGSHGVGVAGFADLVFPTITVFEKAVVFKNLFGSVRETSVVINCSFGPKSDFEVFSIMFDYLDSFFFKNFLRLAPLNGLYYSSNLSSLNLLFNSNSLRGYTWRSYIRQISGKISDFFCLWYNVYFYGRVFFNNFYVFSKLHGMAGAKFKVFFSSWNTVFRSPSSSYTLSYYGERASSIAMASKTLNLCSTIFLNKNFSFTWI